MNKRIKNILIIIGSVLGAVFVTILISNYSFGKIKVELESTEVSYNLDNSGLKYRSSTTLAWVSPGKHKIWASGIKTDNYISKSFEVDVTRGKTSAISISLEPTENNPDFATAEFNPNSSEVQNLIEKLPITNPLGIFTYSYDESQFFVYLEKDMTHEKAIKWFKGNGVIIGDNDIIWKEFISE